MLESLSELEWLQRNLKGVFFKGRGKMETKTQFDRFCVVRFLDEIPGSFLVVTRQPGDKEAPEDVSTFRESFKSDSIYVGFDQEIQQKLARIPKPKVSNETNGSNETHDQCRLFQFLMVIFFTSHLFS